MMVGLGIVLFQTPAVSHILNQQPLVVANKLNIVDDLQRMHWPDES